MLRPRRIIEPADLFEDVFLQGVEVHFSIPFVTIKNRVQVGISLGFGAGFPKGTITVKEDTKSMFVQQNGQTNTQTNSETTVAEAKDEMFPVVPVVKVEAEVGVILAPGLKVRFGGGLNLPSQKAMHVAVVYLIGANQGLEGLRT